MFESLSFPILLLIFLTGAVVVWFAGIQLADTTDVIASRFGFGEAFGGLILLALATNLPEVAITASAALSHNLGIAIGNILGGIGIQTVVLVLLDIFGLWQDAAYGDRLAGRAGVVCHRHRRVICYRHYALRSDTNVQVVFFLLAFRVCKVENKENASSCAAR